MEASTLHAPATLAKPRGSIAIPLLRIRSDEQLVALFRAGHDDAFRVIHDRYHKRLFAYTRQMLPARQDAEDALQDVFVRAYSGLRASDRDLALRAWLFRVAHNRCIDELRRPAPPLPELLHLVRSSGQDPVVEVDLRESLRRLIADVRRLPDQQRSALLLRELGGLSYAELATALGISVGAVKSVLVRARIALAREAEARDTACADIREELVGAYDRGVRPNSNARRHMRECAGCRGFRRELRGVNRQLAALAPTLGPLGFLAKLLGISGSAGGGATATGATAGGATAGGAALLGGGGAAASSGGVALGAGHVATLIAAAVATAGGAVEIQHTITAPAHHHHAKVHIVAKRSPHFNAPGPQVSPASYAPAQDNAATAADAQSAGVVTQNASAAGLAHHPTVKHRHHKPPPSGTGGIAPTKSPTRTASTGAGTDKAASTGALLPAAGTTASGTSTPTQSASAGSICSTSGTTVGGTTASGTTASGTTASGTTASGTTASASTGTAATAAGTVTGTPSCTTTPAANTTNDGSSSAAAGSGSGTTGTSAGSTSSTSGSTGSGSSTSTGSSGSTASTPVK